MCAVASVVTATARAQAPPPLLFPVVKGADWSDTFGAPRTGHTHQGQDLMAPKLRPLIACFAGTVVLHRNRGTAGNWITLTGVGAYQGWRAEYMHINNDTPGTNDGVGGDRYAFAPGLKDGDAVQAGQFLGYVGNSGNAEGADPHGSHCHFELYGPRGVINAAPVLRSARIVSLAETKGLAALPPPKEAGPLRIVGVVLATFPDQAEAVVKVTSITEFGGSPIALRPPRVKRLVFGGSGAPASPLALGTQLTAEGKDMGRGRPLRVARLTIQGVETLFTNAADGDLREYAHENTGTRASRKITAPPAPRLPERFGLESFDRGVYQGWRLDGDCWGHAPEPIYQGTAFRTVPGAVGRYYLSTAHPRIGDNRPSTGTGVAQSPEFAVTHTKLRFLIGGGNYPGEVCLNLLVGGRVARTATGDGYDRLSPVEWDIAEFTGKRARLEIVDKRAMGQRAYLLLDELELVGLPVAAVAEADPVEPVLLETAPIPASGASDAVDGVVPQAFVLLPDGTRVEGVRLMTLEATGYGPNDNGKWGDQTALGTKVGFGTVAVDPKIIPLRKHLWVEGYGFCIALDTGGAIKGMRIDLGHDNETDAAAVGRKKVRVLILD